MAELAVVSAGAHPAATAAPADRWATTTALAVRVGTKRFARIFDVVVAGSALVVAAPLLALCALAIRCTSRGPVLFRQPRVGRDGLPFEVIKLRTMRVDADDSMHREQCVRELSGDTDAGSSDGLFKPEADPRVTLVGRVLRRTSLDELPQLWNVVRGDMAIVGPRPLLAYEVELHSPYHRQRQFVRPGLTGLWQVSGRSRLSALEMLDLDVEYVRRRSWRTDIDILLRTPRVVLQGDGAR